LQIKISAQKRSDKDFIAKEAQSTDRQPLFKLGNRASGSVKMM